MTDKSELRQALIEAGRAAGAFLDDSVSDDFLLYVPGEVRGRIARLENEIEALAAQPRDDVREAAAKYGKPNKHGHVTRYSDSSLYDEKCVLCGMVDGSIMSPREQTIYNTDCPKNPPALRTDRKAVLEEAAKTAAEERLQEPQDESDEAYNRGVRDAIAAILALAEGAGK